MPYNHRTIESKWRRYWAEKETFRAEEHSKKPKYYVLDMFPYPSGAGLHVGHPLGYIGSDIVARHKRHQGFNVLHPMGWDAFGLPAEQYAIQTGQHPAVTTKANIKTYTSQLANVGLSFDWSREISTCDPSYYKWTQWAFLEMFESYFDKKANKARPISDLARIFESEGNKNVEAASDPVEIFSENDWKSFSEKKREETLLRYRIAYLADLPVNWCPALGSVLANDEIKDGLSVRGGHPVEQRIMRQWSLRVSAYAERLLESLNQLDWSEAIKEAQRNWIGKSEGAEVRFAIDGTSEAFEIFTTRPDTIFGVSFMVLAPESEWVEKVTTPAEKKKVDAYVKEAKNRSERERQADVKNVSGVFTGRNAVHPFTGKPIPIWVSDYVLGGYGTGAIMAVPAHDSRDHAFAKHFHLPILPVVEGGDCQAEPLEAKSGKMQNSDFLNGLEVPQAILRAIKEIESKKLGRRKINYRLRDAIFSRQRYWGEPFPIYYKDGMPHAIRELPVELPEVDKYLPTETGEPPLGRAKNWQTTEGYPIELSTMPGFAGSSAYFFRYMDPHNESALASKEALNYWREVDLYVGGSEHATGHLIYSRFWTKVLFDLGHVPVDEPFKKLVNQGLIQGRSSLVYRLKKDPNTFVSYELKKDHDVQEIHVDVSLVQNDVLDQAGFKNWRPEFKNAKFITKDGEYRTGYAIEKMSKSLFNVVNPDSVVNEYGADTLRLFEMFLGPLEQAKPWNTQGIEGVFRFLQKVWRWYHGGDDRDELLVDDAPAAKEHLRVLHQTIDKVSKDIDALSFNTSVAQFMICVNELSGKTNSREILESFAVLLSPFAPHIAEELWQKLGHKESVEHTPWPKVDPSLLKSDTVKVVIQVNGKLRGECMVPMNAAEEDVFRAAEAVETVKIHLADKSIRKRIYVKNKLVNFVV